MRHKEKWYTKTYGILLMLVLFFPAGLALMWNYMRINKSTKILITVFFSIVCLSVIAQIFPESEETGVLMTADVSSVVSSKAAVNYSAAVSVSSAVSSTAATSSATSSLMTSSEPEKVSSSHTSSEAAKPDKASSQDKDMSVKTSTSQSESAASIAPPPSNTAAAVTDITSSQPIQASTEGPKSYAEAGGDNTTDEIIGGLNDIVYWVPKGKSYHSRINCRSLSRSKNIIEGTLEEARRNGYLDPCNNCY